MKKAEETKLKILNAGLICWPDISTRNVGTQCRLTHSAVLHHFPGDGVLREAIASHAVDTGNKRVVRLLICQDHPAIMHMQPLERAEWFAGI